MDQETEKDVINFLRTVATSGIDPNMCSDALDLLLETQTGASMIGQFRVSPTQYRQIVGFIKDEKKIMAIKHMRAASGCGLVEAKNAVEDWMAYNIPKKAKLPDIAVDVVVEEDEDDDEEVENESPFEDNW